MKIKTLKILFFKIKKYKHLIYILFFLPQISYSQNIFDIDNSVKYAEYLFSIKDYKEAEKEYKRVIFLSPDSIKYKKRLLNIYFKTEQKEKGITAIENFFGQDVEVFTNDIINLYIQMLFMSKEYDVCENTLKLKTNLKKTEHQEYLLAVYLLKNKQVKAESLIKNVNKIANSYKSKKFNKLEKTYSELIKTKKKKPFLASVLSTIIPGLGKIYVNDIKNGIGVFSIVGFNAWQSYRGFKNEGIKSFYGWSFGALGTSFYIGNIYGSFKSAQRENNYRNNSLQKKVKDIIAAYNYLSE